MESEHDQMFLKILRDEGNVVNFLDAFFGFLHRRTDFYIESSSEGKLGFPSGVGEKLVLSSMHKWRCAPSKEISSAGVNVVSDSSSSSRSKKSAWMQSEDRRPAPPVEQEVETESYDQSRKVNAPSKPPIAMDHASDSYNGAVREKYVWTQTSNDLDVLVTIPDHIKTSKHTRVSISSDEIKVDIKSSASTDDTGWDNVLNGKLSFKIRRDESIWSIVPGTHISIHLEKVVERWWEALIVGEPKIELSKIDRTKYLHDMASDEQMKVQELMWNNQQKLLGKPTSEQIKMEAILKQAWDAKDSPFRGTPYDPSIIKYS